MPRKTAKFDEETFERHNKRRQSMGMTWNEYLDEEAPETHTLTGDDVREIVREEMERAFRELHRNNGY